MRKKLTPNSLRAARHPPDPITEIHGLYGLDSRLLREFTLPEPQCSLALGASGIAYSLARVAELLHDSQLLLAADAWITAAERHASGQRAFMSPAKRITRRGVGFASLAFAEPGLFYVKSIIRSRMADPAGADAAARQFLMVAKSRLSRLADVHVGGLGLAVGANQLATWASTKGLRTQLSSFSRSVVRSAWTKTGAEIRRNQLLGFAHGIAGQVFATFACGDKKTALPVLEQLRETAIPHQRALIWPTRAGSNRYSLGWCNGLAGHLLMWTRVWQHSQDNQDREIMERLAWGVWKYRMRLGDLCCGATGQAVLMAAFSAATGDHHRKKETVAWLHSFRPYWTREFGPHSLFHGRLGRTLALIECEYAVCPRFPIYQHDSL